MTDDRALSGIRVLDLTSIVVGPSATLRLADLGAEVIKIEPPSGDNLRVLGGVSPSGRLSGKYMHFNRAKRSICLDLKTPAAQAAIRSLLKTCDVFVSNMRPEALGRLGLDVAACRDLHPSLIHCTITGFGPGGPYRGRPAYDTVIQGVSGVAGLFLKRDGAPNYVPLLICDHTVGEITATAITAALFRRERTGVASSLEIPMFETMAAFVLQENLGAASFHPALGPPGDMRVLDPNNRPVATADGWISLSANTDPQARAFLRVISREDLIKDERFCNVAARFKNATEWFNLRAVALKEKTTAYWLAAFDAADIPAMVCHTLETLTDDPHLKQAGLTTTQEHPTEGEVSVLHPTIIVDGQRIPAGHSARPLGWDTSDVLRELGLSADAIEQMFASGAAIDGRRRASRCDRVSMHGAPE